MPLATLHPGLPPQGGEGEDMDDRGSVRLLGMQVGGEPVGGRDVRVELAAFEGEPSVYGCAVSENARAVAEDMIVPPASLDGVDAVSM